jgi:mRNA-degrading endonuclease RelE of RelBE toxin-antitoxin system
VRFRIEYSPEAEAHLYALSARDQVIVLDAIERQLSYQPTVETRHRKPMRPNPLAPWELRIGNLRVYDDVKERPKAAVQILGIGIKERYRVRAGQGVIEL